MSFTTLNNLGHKMSFSGSGRFWSGHKLTATGWQNQRAMKSSLEARLAHPTKRLYQFHWTQGGDPLSNTGHCQTPAVTILTPHCHQLLCKMWNERFSVWLFLWRKSPRTNVAELGSMIYKCTCFGIPEPTSEALWQRKKKGKAREKKALRLHPSEP